MGVISVEYGTFLEPHSLTVAFFPSGQVGVSEPSPTANGLHSGCEEARGGADTEGDSHWQGRGAALQTESTKCPGKARP